MVRFIPFVPGHLRQVRRKPTRGGVMPSIVPPDHIYVRSRVVEDRARRGVRADRNAREAVEGHCAYDECDPAEEAAVRAAHAKRPGLLRRLFTGAGEAMGTPAGVNLDLHRSYCPPGTEPDYSGSECRPAERR
jgi:hypothetical protein